MANIPLSSGQFAIVDDNDYAQISQWTWSATSCKYTIYAHRQTSLTEKGKNVYMHRQLLDAPPGVEIDHINGNGLDNRRANLRIVTRGQNNLNRHNRPTRCKFPAGVEQRRKNGRFTARVEVEGRRYSLGTYDTAEEAHKVYLKARIRALQGEEI